jgi:hypothetical protein
VFIVKGSADRPVLLAVYRNSRVSGREDLSDAAMDVVRLACASTAARSPESKEKPDPRYGYER